MHIEDLKRWHWMLISLVVGLALAYVYSGLAAEGGPSNRRTIAPGEVINRIGWSTKVKSGQDMPIIRNLRIYPPVENKNLVTLEEFIVSTDRATGQRTGEYQERQFVAEIPFVLGRGKPPTETWTIRDELAKRQERNKKIEFTYVSLAATPWVYAVCMTASFLLIGVIWPTVQNRLQGAGYGAPPRQKQETISLSKSRPSKPSVSTPMKKGPTQADLDQLDAVTARYQQNVAGMASASAGESKSGLAVAEPPKQRKWETGPLEVKEAPKPTEEDEVEVKGEYYPVLIHHKKEKHEGDEKK